MTDQRRFVAITGGAGGIGMAAAEALVTDGYAVALLDCAEEALERHVNTRVAMSTKHYQHKDASCVRCTAQTGRAGFAELVEGAQAAGTLRRHSHSPGPSSSARGGTALSASPANLRVQPAD